MKYKCYLVEPGDRISPIDHVDMLPDGYAIMGNGDLTEYIPDDIQHVWNVLEDGELADVIEWIAEGHTDEYRNITAAIEDYLPRTNGKKHYSGRQIASLREIVTGHYDSTSIYDRIDNLCAALTIITGNIYDTQTIRGCVQGEWTLLVYPVRKGDEERQQRGIDELEQEYFNLCEEWRVYSVNDETGDEHYEVNLYTYADALYNAGKAADEIRDQLWCDKGDEIELYAGWTTETKYRKIA